MLLLHGSDRGHRRGDRETTAQEQVDRRWGALRQGTHRRHARRYSRFVGAARGGASLLCGTRSVLRHVLIRHW